MQLLIEKMSCEGCVRTITEAITAVDPQANVAADIGNRTVSVDTKAAWSRIEKALSDAGYPARVA